MPRIRSETAPKYAGLKPLTHEERVILAQAESILAARLNKGEAMIDPDTAGRYCVMRLGALEHEEFHVLYLDSRHRVIAAECAFTGTVDGAEVHPREVAKRALYHNACALIIAHNHPSGNLDPSAADRALTTRLQEALRLLGIRILDHFIVGGDKHSSFAARGFI